MAIGIQEWTKVRKNKTLLTLVQKRRTFGGLNIMKYQLAKGLCRRTRKTSALKYFTAWSMRAIEVVGEDLRNSA